MTETAWRDRYLRVGGVTTHYLEAGEGPPMVLLHGGEYGASAELTWEGCLPELARHHRVIALDFEGFGRSDKIRDFVGQRSLMVRQVGDLLDALCVGPAYFVGVSLSGRMLLDVARREPAPWRIAGMTVAGLGLLPPRAEVARTLSDYDGSREGLKPILELLFHSDDFARNEEYLDRRHAACLEPGAWECAAAAHLRSPARGAGSRPASAPDYSAVRQPVRLVVGEHDRLVPREDWDALAAALPDASGVVVPGAGHYPQIERPQAFVEAVLTHAASLPPAKEEGR